MYDLAIIGAGVNGCSVAHEFNKLGKKVIIFDMDGFASGGSGAAGAFIAPKFSKAGDLKDIIHDAFVYSMNFYEKEFKHLFTKTQLLHIAKDDKSSEILKYYKKHTSLELKNTTKEFDFEHISIDAGIVDAKAICQSMGENATFIKEKVISLVYKNSSWYINETYNAKNILLSSGAYEPIIKEPYIKLRGIWGHRIDIKTSTKNLYSVHQFVSISPTNGNKLAIGATHDVHYHPQKTKKPYDFLKAREELLQKANKTLNLQDVEVIADFTGLRSGSLDYIPIVGKVVNSKETLASKSIKFKVKKPNFDNYIYYPNLYMINGNGGYGFVLAPYLAKILSEHIVNGKKISNKLSPARFFARWAKKL